MSYSGITDYLASNPVTFQQAKDYGTWKAENGMMDDEQGAAIGYQAYMQDINLGNKMASMAFEMYVSQQKDLIDSMKRLM